MDLHPEPFESIVHGSKRIEMRLNDERRQSIKIGDLIVFKNRESQEEITTEVLDLKPFNSFNELYASYDKALLGYQKDEPANPDDMLKYYSKEQIDKYGVLAIEIKLY